ncbi:hypothetical protein IHN32_11555 [Deinococcus sp. 14RED07]|uniref:hypothetical protein n=1 Tax=Deinococcus sp. 14RED07 TaxID=2745874 RepID=UPI001E3615AE|nr:hypothetical protein [Deinococcus sp. 14RED07]MCD0176576.1 hypothetical protein [Deinococcus sp. 14RED07]
MLDDLYVAADDRPPATLRILIAHAAEVRRSSSRIYPILDALPDLDFMARRLLNALDEDTRDLHHAAQAFALACLRAARHRWQRQAGHHPRPRPAGRGPQGPREPAGPEGPAPQGHAAPLTPTPLSCPPCWRFHELLPKM